MGSKSSRTNSFARWRRDDRGAAAVEFAFVAPVLFFSVLSLLEIGMMGMMISQLDNAVIEVARRIRTGQDTAPTSSVAFQDQVCAALHGVGGACRDRLTISVRRFDSFSNANDVASNPPDGQFDLGGPGDIMVVKVDYKWPLTTPFLATAFHRDGPMDVTLGARTAFKNEPYQ